MEIVEARACFLSSFTDKAAFSCVFVQIVPDQLDPAGFNWSRFTSTGGCRRCGVIISASNIILMVSQSGSSEINRLFRGDVAVWKDEILSEWRHLSFRRIPKWYKAVATSPLTCKATNGVISRYPATSSITPALCIITTSWSLCLLTYLVKVVHPSLKQPSPFTWGKNKQTVVPLMSTRGSCGESVLTGSNFKMSKFSAEINTLTATKTRFCAFVSTTPRWIFI